MTVTDKNILETYSNLFEGLSFSNKIELIERLTKSLKSNKSKENNFYKSFGAFVSEKSAEEIVAEIKSSRSFRDKEIKF
ncbi:glycosyltransferase family 1 protein [Flavobacterium daemonense]|uniref:glycosyltransferase family 1 protein n=1 Tax=Flavobacterium daemonense TaxID=1393049 RepID=UPI0011865D9D|nr:glycosyltransferase family 1 protein [Flavobacterium daemonense]KAF2331395.1 glycosyltransferase family 1 protein [Flavobacterium daemonense]